MISNKKDEDKHTNIEKNKNTMTCLRFCSGALGLDLGLEKAGFTTLLASEIDEQTRNTIVKNKPKIGLIGDLREYTVEDIYEYARLDKDDDIDLVAGGPPCQAFSTAGHRKGFEDERGNVFLHFLNLATELNPKFIIIENVRGLLSAPLHHIPHNKRDERYKEDNQTLHGTALLYIIKKIRNAGYGVSFNLYNAANYGAPQIRERLVLICSREKKEMPFLIPTHSDHKEFGLPPWRTLRDAIEDLKEEDQEYIEFPEKRLKFYRLLKSGQNWRDLPVELQKEALGNAYFSGGGKSGFLRRLAWDKPSPTLVTSPAMPATDLAHPVKNRPLSIQEYMRIQEFPDNWIVMGNLLDKYRQIGNAVPISLGYAIGNLIKKSLVKEQNIENIKGFPYSRYRDTDNKTW